MEGSYLRYMDIAERLRLARERVRLLEKELASARRDLDDLLNAPPEPSREAAPSAGHAAVEPPAAVSASSSSAEKVALFRARFMGRDDVYALPWESRRTGKKGWSPAVRGGFYTDAITDADLLPLTDDVVERHLRGDSATFHVGLYPMTRDDHCALLVCDFDDGSWREDATAYAEACRRAGIDTLAEISRSGDGAHVWMFFDASVPAASARTLGSAMLRAAMADRASISMASYDRFFPSQDVLPQRSPGRMRFGNLIALPLQGGCRRRGTTVFADPHSWDAYDDQFAALSKVVPVPAERLTEYANGSNRLPAGPRESLAVRPRRAAIRAEAAAIAGRAISVRRDEMVHVPVANVPNVVIAELKHVASISNPEFYRRQAQRFSTFGTPRLVTCFEHDDVELRLPRGLLDEATSVLRDTGFTVEVDFDGEEVKPIDVAFEGELRPEQRAAVTEMLRYQTGVLVAPPGAGKTVMACALIAERATPTAILVNRADLLQQWRTRLTEFLGISDKQIGQLGGGRRKRRGVVDLIMMQSIAHRTGDPRILEEYGQVIVDECHAVAAPAVEAAIRVVNVKNWVGLTATPYRADQMDGLITMQCGPIRHVVDAGSPTPRRLVVHVTDFTTDEPGTDGPSMQMIYNQLAESEPRNGLIVSEIVRASEAGQRSLVLTNRIDHVQSLTAKLGDQTSVPVFALHGRLRPVERRTLLNQLRELDDERMPFVLVAIDKVAGEGIDLPSLNALFLAMPVSFKGRVIQQTGRITRGGAGADSVVVVHDFHDAAVPWLDRMHHKRRRVMQKEGFLINLDSGP